MKTSTFVFPFFSTTQLGSSWVTFAVRDGGRKMVRAAQPLMSIGGEPMNRRAMLRGMGLAAAGIIAVPVFALDKEMLKEDVEELNYEEELTDIGPDSREKLATKAKKKEPVPEYRQEQQALIKSEEKKYDQMVAEELKDEKSTKEKFEEYMKEQQDQK